jgi:CheY-like chemotaxis protein
MPVPPGESPESRPVAPTILVVDDSAVIREVFGGILRSAGYAVREAATGAAGLQRASEGPDLIVLDVDLPDLDGYEVCRRLKQDPATVSSRSCTCPECTGTSGTG